MEDKLLEILLFLLRLQREQIQNDLKRINDRIVYRHLANLSEMCESYIEFIEDLVETEETEDGE